MKRITGSYLFQLLRYQARLIWHINLWLAPLIGFLIALTMYFPDASNHERLFWMFKWSENFFPLLGITILPNLFSQEMENQTAELWLAKSVSRTKVVLTRVFTVCAYTVLVVLIPLTIKYFTYVHFNWGEIMLVVLPPIFYLGLLGMVIGILTRHSVIAFLVPLIYWFFEMTTKGKYTGIFYLFSRTLPGVACTEFFEGCLPTEPNFPWIVSKLLLIGLCVGFIYLSVLLLDNWVLRFRSRQTLLKAHK